MIDDVQMYPEVSFCNFSPGAVLDYHDGKRHNFELSVYVPLLSVYLRNNYSTAYPQIYEIYRQKYFVNHNVKAAVPGKLRALEAEAGYRLDMTPRLGLAARYRFGYMYLADPRPLRRVYGLYTVGMIFNL